MAYPYINPYQPIQQQSNMYYYVNGFEGARQFQLMPNQTVLLMDNDNPLLYVKSTNQMGQSSIKTFKLEEVNSNVNNNNDYLSKIDERLKVIEAKFKDENK